MGAAWIDGYWLNYSTIPTYWPGDNVSTLPRLSFEIPTQGQGYTLWPWMFLHPNTRFDVISKQLDSANVFIRWYDSTKEVYSISAVNNF